MKRLLLGMLLVAPACVQDGPPHPSAIQTGSPSTLDARTEPTGPKELSVTLNVGTHLTGDEEVPPRSTRAQGQAIFRLNEDGTELSYRLIASNIENVIAAHIHNGPFGANGPIVVFLFGNVPPGGGRTNGVLATGTLTGANLINALAGQPLSALINLMESGNAYVNVHTNDGVDPQNTGPGDFPGGEIRGQLPPTQARLP